MPSGYETWWYLILKGSSKLRFKMHNIKMYNASLFVRQFDSDSTLTKIRLMI